MVMEIKMKVLKHLLEKLKKSLLYHNKIYNKLSLIT